MKKLVALLLLCTVLLSACTSPQVKTIVVEESFPLSDINVNRIYNVDTVDGEKTVNYIGFDSQNKLVGIRAAAAGGQLVATDFVSNETREVMPPVLDIYRAELADSGRMVLYEKQTESETDAYLLNLQDGTTRKIAGYDSADVVVPPSWIDAGGDLSYVLGQNREYTVYRVDRGTFQTSAIKIAEIFPSQLEKLAANAVVKIAFLTNENNFVAEIENSEKTYLAVKDLNDTSKVPILAECEGKQAVSAEGMVYYTNQNGSLMMLDVSQNQEVELAQNVEKFSVSAESGKVAYFVRENLADKIYVKNIKNQDASLVDIRQGAQEISLSPDGTKLLVKYADDADTTAVEKCAVFDLSDNGGE